MSVKARLRILLLADEVLVAESADEQLWQELLGRIAAEQGRDVRLERYTGSVVDTDRRFPPGAAAGASAEAAAAERDSAPEAGALAAFAAEIGVERNAVAGACDPSSTPPFMHLDRIAWEEFKRLNPRRGPAAVPPIVLAGTLLALWSRHAGLAAVTVNHTQSLLETVDVRDKNPTRGLKNCEWLQLRDGAIKLNPARVERARAVARAFCAGQRVSG